MEQQESLQNKDSTSKPCVEFEKFDQERRRIERKETDWIPDNRPKFLGEKREMPS
ncbi:MAG: hypothetical protein WC774_04380 [Candidatus Gracilibacteria bacterium]|jgi:hypothetical protein